MVMNALRWTLLENLLEGLAYTEALAAVTNIFVSFDSEEVERVEVYFNIQG